MVMVAGQYERPISLRVRLRIRKDPSAELPIPLGLQTWKSTERSVTKLSEEVDASYPGLQIPQQEGQEIRCYSVKVIKATTPGQYARKSTVKNAVPRQRHVMKCQKSPKLEVSLKLGWAYDGANFHPGKWDHKSWSISGMGSVCCDEGYQVLSEESSLRLHSMAV
eukprot:s1293_g11.t1